MSTERPIALNLFKVHFPVTAIVSILHRVSGIALFLFLPIFFYFLQLSLATAAGYGRWQQIFACSGMRCLVGVFLAAALYHLFAGVRHLFLDIGWGESRTAARGTAWLLLVLFALSVISLGVWLC